MSYILEALKRAERERRAGSNSLLDETPGASSAAAAPAWQRWIMPATILALAAAIVAYLIFGGHRQRSSPAVPVAVAAAPVPAAAMPASKPIPTRSPAAPALLPRLKAEPPPETSASAIEDDGRISSLKDLDDKSAPPSPAVATAPISDESEDAESAAAPRASTIREKPNAPMAADDGAASRSSSADDAEPSSLSNAEAARSDSASTAAAASTQNLREMPDDFRAGFPAITVDVHAYSDDPAQRFVLVGGKRYHEGDALPQGPRIFGIVPEGIVFDWQGQRVLYAMNR